MSRKIRISAVALCLAAAGISAASSASASAPSAPSTPPAVTVVGNSHGVKLQSEHTNPDGTVTSSWKNATGQGFTYSGPTGAQVTLTPSVTTVAGQTVHRMDVSAAPPAHAPGTLKAAAAAYAAAGRSPLKDALNAGANPAQAQAKYGSSTKPVSQTTAGVTPMDTSDGNRVASWCVATITGSDLIGSRDDATGCVTEYLVQSSPEYISDDMESLGTVDYPGGRITGLAVYSDYRSGTVVPPWIPNGSQGTNCNDVSVSAAFGGFTFSSSSTICGGSYVTMRASNTFGMHWSGNIQYHSQIGLEPIDIVSIPNGDDYTLLKTSMWW